jgi:hypothetical protein
MERNRILYQDRDHFVVALSLTPFFIQDRLSIEAIKMGVENPGKNQRPTRTDWQLSHILTRLSNPSLEHTRTEVRWQ